MSEAKQAIDYVLTWEGGFVDNPKDPGGATNFGLSLRWYQQFVNPNATVETIKNLTQAQAEDLYHDKLWTKLPYAQLTNQTIANYLFDMAVNCGEHPAVQTAQRAMWGFYGFERPKDDGLMGPVTIASLNAPNEHFLPCFRSVRADYYRLIVAKNPMLQPFLNGWLRRAYQCRTLVMDRKNDD